MGGKKGGAHRLEGKVRGGAGLGGAEQIMNQSLTCFRTGDTLAERVSTYSAEYGKEYVRTCLKKKIARQKAV